MVGFQQLEGITAILMDAPYMDVVSRATIIKCAGNVEAVLFIPSPLHFRRPVITSASKYYTPTDERLWALLM